MAEANLGSVSLFFCRIESDKRKHFSSVVTVGELQRGVALYPLSRKRAALAKWLKEILKHFEGRISPVDSEIAVTWGNYSAAQQQKGRKPRALDSLVAATALVDGLTVATRNLDRFLDVPLTSPWNDE